MKDFFHTNLAEFQEELIENGFEKYRAKQVFDSVYAKRIFNPAEFKSVPNRLKEWLAENWRFAAAELEGGKTDTDETKKYLFRLSDGRHVESVLIRAPDDDGKVRKTLCLSTQVGCACGCKFCASARRGFVRNLSAAEIVSQALPFAAGSGSPDRAFEFENIVVMGMGEPLMNFDNLIAALRVFNAPEMFGFGARRITVSTCGIADKIEHLAEIDFPYRLAISLHGATDEVREKIMPIDAKYPLGRLIDAAKIFAKKCGRMITLEFIMIDGVNDSFEQARKLAEIALQLHAHVNLIPYNTVGGLPWKRSGKARRAAFADILRTRGVSFTLRKEKGAGIEAACGQLALREDARQEETAHKHSREND